jgi:hypothetical protein
MLLSRGPRAPRPLAFFLIALLSGCAGAGASQGSAPRPGETCSVELWSVSWNVTGQPELSEDSILQSPLAHRYRNNDCNYAYSVREWMKKATPLPSSPSGLGDIRLLARVTTGVSSWLLAIPLTCHWVRLDQTRSYRFDPALFALLAQPIRGEDREAIQRFGACGL